MIDALCGEMETTTGGGTGAGTGAAGGAVTVIVDVSDLVGSATLVATTWYTPAVVGAVYVPSAATLPPSGVSATDQVTTLLGVPLTPATNATVWPAITVAVVGVTETRAPRRTFTFAACALVSALLVP